MQRTVRIAGITSLSPLNRNSVLPITEYSDKNHDNLRKEMCDN